MFKALTLTAIIALGIAAPAEARGIFRGDPEPGSKADQIDKELEQRQEDRAKAQAEADREAARDQRAASRGDSDANKAATSIALARTGIANIGTPEGKALLLHLCKTDRVARRYLVQRGICVKVPR